MAHVGPTAAALAFVGYPAGRATGAAAYNLTQNLVLAIALGCAGVLWESQQLAAIDTSEVVSLTDEDATEPASRIREALPEWRRAG